MITPAVAAGIIKIGGLGGTGVEHEEFLGAQIAAEGYLGDDWGCA
jgi:hypothetical protein